MIKIPFGPEGPDFIWDKFMSQIVEPLMDAKLIKIHDAELKLGQTSAVAEISVFQGGKWTRERSGGTATRLALAKVGQEKGLPIVIEGDEIYFVMDEKDAVIEFLKYG